MSKKNNGSSNLEPEEIESLKDKPERLVMKHSVVRRYVSVHMKQKIAEEFNYRCAYCGREIDDARNAEIDNFLPISQFPEKANEIDNLI